MYISAEFISYFNFLVSFSFTSNDGFQLILKKLLI